MFASKSLAVGFKALNLSTKSGDSGGCCWLCPPLAVTGCQRPAVWEDPGGAGCQGSVYIYIMSLSQLTLQASESLWRDWNSDVVRAVFGIMGWGYNLEVLVSSLFFCNGPHFFLLFSRSSPWSQVPRHLVLFGASERLQPLRKKLHPSTV